MIEGLKRSVEELKIRVVPYWCVFTWCWSGFEDLDDFPPGCQRCGDYCVFEAGVSFDGCI